jgi:hypothetical protein
MMEINISIPTDNPVNKNEETEEAEETKKLLHEKSDKDDEKSTEGEELKRKSFQEIEVEMEEYVQMEKDYFYIIEKERIGKIKPTVDLITEISQKVNFTEDENKELPIFVKDCIHLFNGEWTRINYVQNFKIAEGKEFELKEERKLYKPCEIEATMETLTFKGIKLNLEHGELEPLFCSIYLYHTIKEKRVSETFYFSLSSFSVINEFITDLKEKKR